MCGQACGLDARDVKERGDQVDALLDFVIQPLCFGCDACF